MSAGPRLSRAGLQAALLALLVGERLLAATAPAWTATHRALTFLLLGLWLAWPARGLHAPRARLAAVPGAGLLLAGAGAAWCALAPGLLATLGAAAPWALVLGVLLLDPAAVRRVLRLTRIEALKLSRSRLARGGLLVSAALTLLAGLTAERLEGETGWSATTAMLGAGFAVAQVFLLVLGAVAVAGEASQGTLKMILPHAYRRSDWVLAKGLALGLTALAFAVVVAGAALGQTALREGFDDVRLTAEGFGGEPLVTVHATAQTLRGHLAQVLAAQGLALLVTAVLGLVISCALPSVVSALCTAFLAFAALRLGDLVLALDQDTLRRLYLWAPERMRDVVGKLGRGLSEGWDERLPQAAVLLCLATGGALLIAAVRLLARKDLAV